MKIKDKDGNRAEVRMLRSRDGVLGLESRRAVVAIHANAVWLTPSQARKFGRSIIQVASKAEKARGRG